MIRPYDRRATKGRKRRAARRVRRVVVSISLAGALLTRVAMEAGLNRAIDEAQRALASSVGRGNPLTFNVGA